MNQNKDIKAISGARDDRRGRERTGILALTTRVCFNISFTYSLVIKSKTHIHSTVVNNDVVSHTRLNYIQVTFKMRIVK